MSADYAPAVDQLLRLGEKRLDEHTLFPLLGIGEAHVPQLIALATDEDLLEGNEQGDAIWGPIYAWRALGQLRAPEAVEPLLSILWRADEEDWVAEEVPKALVQIGPGALPALAAYLLGDENGTWPRTAAVGAVEKIAQQYPEARETAVNALLRALERFASQSSTLNSFLIDSLLNLKVVEARDLIREAYRARRVDVSILGEYGDVEVALGVRAPNPAVQPLPIGRPDPGVTLQVEERAGRNDPCPCGSGLKYKKCCLVMKKLLQR